MFAFEIESNQSWPRRRSSGHLVQQRLRRRIRRLPTHYGVLTYELRHESPNRLRLRLSGDLSVPPGGIQIRPPLPAPSSTRPDDLTGAASLLHKAGAGRHRRDGWTRRPSAHHP
jgi:hypothetical protein